LPVARLSVASEDIPADSAKSPVFDWQLTTGNWQLIQYKESQKKCRLSQCSARVGLEYCCAE
jgi:hypothetical protein